MPIDPGYGVTSRSFDWNGDEPVCLDELVWPDADRSSGQHYQISWSHQFDEDVDLDPRGINVLISPGTDLMIYATDDIWTLNATDCRDTKSMVVINNPRMFKVRLNLPSNDADSRSPVTYVHLTNDWNYAAFCESDTHTHDE